MFDCSSEGRWVFIVIILESACREEDKCIGIAEGV
jgi:hypothetical protein